MKKLIIILLVSVLSTGCITIDDRTSSERWGETGQNVLRTSDSMVRNSVEGWTAITLQKGILGVLY